MPWQGRRMMLASMPRLPSTPWRSCTGSEVVQRYHGDDEHVIKLARPRTVYTWHSRLRQSVLLNCSFAYAALLRGIWCGCAQYM